MDLLDYRDCACEIKTAKNYLVALGRISRVTDEYMEITSRREHMPLQPVNSVLKLKVYGPRAGFLVLTGVVYLSTEDFIRVTDVKQITEFEQRKFFRVELFMDAKVCKGEPEEGEPPEEAELIHVVLLDASLNGLCFRSNQRFGVGETLTVRLSLYDRETTFPCVVCRAKEMPESALLEYGCQLLDTCGEQDKALLSRYLFQKQREQIQRFRGIL